MYYPDYYSTILNQILAEIQRLITVLESFLPFVKYIYILLFMILFIQILRLVRGK